MSGATITATNPQHCRLVDGDADMMDAWTEDV